MSNSSIFKYFSKESTFSFHSLVFGYDVNPRTARLPPLAAPQYSSCSLQVMMRPARGCLSFCAQTLVHTQPTERLSHLDTSFPVSHLLTVWWLRQARLFRPQILLGKSAMPMKADTSSLSRKLLFTCFSNACPWFCETVLPLCAKGGWWGSPQPSNFS